MSKSSTTTMSKNRLLPLVTPGEILLEDIRDIEQHQHSVGRRDVILRDQPAAVCNKVCSGHRDRPIPAIAPVFSQSRVRSGSGADLGLWRIARPHRGRDK